MFCNGKKKIAQNSSRKYDLAVSITYSDQYVTSHCSENLSKVYVSYKS